MEFAEIIQHVSVQSKMNSNMLYVWWLKGVA